MIIRIKVIPNARTSNVPGKRAVEGKNGVLVVRVNKVPEKGKANEAVIKLLAKHFNVAKSKVKILRGLTSRNKVVEIEG